MSRKNEKESHDPAHESELLISQIWYRYSKNRKHKANPFFSKTSHASCNFATQNGQGRSQPHHHARVGKSSTFLILPKISINFFYFSSNFYHFLAHFGSLGGGVAHPERPWLHYWKRVKGRKRKKKKKKKRKRRQLPLTLKYLRYFSLPVVYNWDPLARNQN